MKHISLITNVGKSQISETDTEFLINNVPITVDGAVMNGLLYRAEDNKAGMETIRNKVVTLSHPTDSNGNGLDAYEGEALQNHYSGGNVEKVMHSNGVWYANISINKNILEAQDKNQDTDFYTRLSNREDVGVSTGLYTIPEEKSGTNEKGIKYNAIATKQEYNHLAMLESSEPPAGGDATFMRFNGEEEVKCEKLYVNLDEYVEKISNEDSLVDKFTKAMVGLLSKNKANEEANMTENMKNMVEALKKKNMYKDNMSEDEVKNAYDKMMKGDDKEKEGMKKNAESDALLSAINRLTDKVESLEQKVNAQDDLEKDKLITEIKANSKDFEDDELKDMPVSTLQKIAKNSAPVGTMSLNSGGFGVQTNSGEYDLKSAIDDM